MATTHLPPDFKEFLQSLNSRDVAYLLIGGYAVGYYGYVRATLEHLKINKKASGQLKDLTDLEHLP